jgi:hypothetical protein
VGDVVKEAHIFPPVRQLAVAVVEGRRMTSSKWSHFKNGCKGGTYLSTRAPVATTLPPTLGKPRHRRVLEGEVARCEINISHLEHVGEPAACKMRDGKVSRQNTAKCKQTNKQTNKKQKTNKQTNKKKIKLTDRHSRAEKKEMWKVRKVSCYVMRCNATGVMGSGGVMQMIDGVRCDVME